MKSVGRVIFFIISLIIVLCIIIVSFTIIIINKVSEKECTVEMHEGNDQNLIYIPVNINDSILPFIFDTGATCSLISCELAQKMGLRAEWTEFWEISRYTEKVWYDTIAFTKKNISIGSLKTNGVFALEGYKGYLIDDIEYKQKVLTIIGKEIIDRFHWLFNFADNTLTISSKGIATLVMRDDQILTLGYNSDDTSICMDITIDGVLLKNVEFDTGFSKSIEVLEKAKNFDIFFSKSDFETLTSKNSNLEAVYMPNDLGKAYIIDSLQINDITMQGVLAFVQSDFTQTYITADFVRRFRMMYFDSTNRKIHLYTSPSDSIRHHRRELQIFRRAVQNYDEDTSNLPSTITELW